MGSYRTVRTNELKFGIQVNIIKLNHQFKPFANKKKLQKTKLEFAESA